MKNCIFSGNDTDLTTADAVIVHLFMFGMIPETYQRKPHQRWIFLDDEAPKNTISVGSRKVELSEMHNLFNWSMTYRYSVNEHNDYTFNTRQFQSTPTAAYISEALQSD